MILFVSLFVSTRFSFAIVLVWIDKKFEIIRALKTRWRSWRKKVAKKKEQKRLKTKLKRRKEAENAIYWLKYGKSVDIRQFKIIKVKNREIAPY